MSSVTDCLFEMGLSLEKSRMILEELTTEYSFSNRPMASIDTTNDEAAKWLWDYNRIITFLEIAEDYIFKVSETLEKAKQIDEDRRAINENTRKT